MRHSVLFFLPLMLGCSAKSDTKVKIDTDSAFLQIEEDSLPTMFSDDNDDDWTPEKFKIEHPAEWAVVKPAINIWQKDGRTGFAQIDGLVHGYIRRNNVVLPQDSYLRILKIEQICKDKFDITGYDETNWGLRIANDASEMFDEYVNWLISTEVEKKNQISIDFAKEEKMEMKVMDAFASCCRSIGCAFEGSGGWIAAKDITQIDKKFRKSMYVAILNPQKHQVLPFLLTAKHFKDECDLRANNYEQNIESEDSATPKKAKSLLHKYYIALKEWLEYRNSIELKITDPILQSEYSYVTRIFAREHYVHLKNVFGDIGMYSDSMYNGCFLHIDCSDEEMLSYNYENAYQNYTKH